MLSRVAAGSLLLAATAHADPPQKPPLDGVAATTQFEPARPEHRVDVLLGTGGAGARYVFSGERIYLDVQAAAEGPRERAGARLGLARFAAFGMEHELVTGVGIVQASTSSDQLGAQQMTTNTTLATTRFLSAYINDTVRFIRGIDVTGGLVVEQWQNLGGASTITYGSGPPMQVSTPDFGGVRVEPTLSVTGHVSDRVALVAQMYRGVREIGPNIDAGRFVARARAFTSDAGSGTAAEISVQPLTPLIATVGYARAARTAGSAALTYTDVRVASLTARVDTLQRVDALAVRRLRGGVSGFFGVDNLLDRRTPDSARRLVMVGVRGTFAR